VLKKIPFSPKNTRKKKNQTPLGLVFFIKALREDEAVLHRSLPRRVDLCVIDRPHRGVAVQVEFGQAKFVTGFSRWVKGQAQGLQAGGFKL
jgi:hypothetical protein